MEADILDGKIGAVGGYDLEFKEGKLTFVVDVAAPGGLVSGKLGLGLDAGAVLDAIAKAIPGTIDDAIISVAKAALLSK